MQKLNIGGLAVDHLPAEGTKVLFVHGSNGGSWYWENYMRAFVEAGYSCYAMNLRGHHPNPDLGDELGKVSFYDYVKDLKTVLKELGNVILIGHSMGGIISQKACEDTPVLAAVFAASAPPDKVKFRIGTPWMLIVESIKNAKRIKNRLPLLPAWKPARKAALNNMGEEEAKAAFARFVPESCVAGIEIGQDKIPVDLSKVKFPMLTIGAKNDKTAPWKMEVDISKFHNTDLVLLENHGHMFMIEPGWEATARQMIDWLRSKKL